MSDYRGLKYSWDDFRGRVELSLKMFSQIETLLEDFLDYVPLTSEHLEVYSLKLVAIILEVGPEILTGFDLATFSSPIPGAGFRMPDTIERARLELFKEEKRLKKRQRSLTFKQYHDFLEQAADIAGPKFNDPIQLKDLDVYVLPFETDRQDWWDSYNLLRHDKYNSLKKATLRNSLKALGALYWLAEHNFFFIGAPGTFTSNIFPMAYEKDARLLKL